MEKSGLPPDLCCESERDGHCREELSPGGFITGIMRVRGLGGIAAGLSGFSPDCGPEGESGERSWLIPFREPLLFSCLILLIFHVYMNSRGGPFVFDDLHNILENPHIRLAGLDFKSLWQAAFDSPVSTRPVVNLSFALNYYFHGYEPQGYRLVNVIIHLCNGFLLYFFLKATFSTPFLKRQYQNLSRYAPFAAACIWLVNPIHTQSVTYIVQRMNSMATLFYLLAFLLFARFRLCGGAKCRLPLLAGCLLSFLLALGSKEITVTLPFFVFLYEWYFFRELSLSWLKRNWFWLGLVAVFLCVMAFVYVQGNPLERIASGYRLRDFTPEQRILTQFRAVVFYLSLFLFPHPSRLNLDHHFPLSQSLLDPPSTLLSIGVVFLLLATAVKIARRSPLLSFCIIWFLGNLVIESSVIGLEIFFEHRTYLPAILFSIIVVLTAHRFIPYKWMRAAAFLVIVALGLVWTHDRNEIWADDIALWRDTMEKSPEKVRPYVNLGIAHQERGQLYKAIDYLNEAVRIDPNYGKARYNLSISLLSMGDFRKAEEHARAAKELDPADDDAINALAISQAEQGRLREAIENLTKAIEVNPHNPETHYNISLALSNAGEIERAVWHCSEALRIQPDYKAAQAHLHAIRSRIQFYNPADRKPFGKSVVKHR